jgi:hypothetical protein
LNCKSSHHLKCLISQSTESKISQITDLAANSKGNVITLNDATFAYYAVSNPRPYSLLVFMTAADPKYKCGVCKQLDREISLLAQSYATDIKAKGGTQELFFIRLDYEKSQRMFQSYQTQSVPVVFHIASSQGDRENAKEYDIAQRDKFQVPQDPDAEMIGNFIRERTGISIKIEHSMIMTYVTLIVLFCGLAALVRPVIAYLPFFLGLIRMKSLWITISAGVYTCAISGLIFDIIRTPPMFHQDQRSGQIMLFYPQSGSQFVAEGFIIGFLNLMCAGSLIFVAAAAPKFKSENNRSAAVIGGMIVFTLCFLQIRGLYVMKNRWYGSNF